MNRELFATALIKGLGMSVTQNRLNIFFAWFDGENTKAQNNPLATTWKKDGSTFFNCLKKNAAGTACEIGVQNYPTETMGVKATLDTLKLSYYKPILAALADNVNTFDRNNEALVKSFKTWGTGYNLFLSMFQKYGKVTGTPATKPVKKEATDKPKIDSKLIIGAAVAFGLYRYSTRSKRKRQK